MAANKNRERIRKMSATEVTTRIAQVKELINTGYGSEADAPDYMIAVLADLTAHRDFLIREMSTRVRVGK